MQKMIHLFKKMINKYGFFGWDTYIHNNFFCYNIY